ncbi:MAG: hypothetical protein VW338_16010 [Rhodospirillaceae bacterium]
MAGTKIDAARRRRCLAALRANGGNVSAAARAAGVSRETARDIRDAEKIPAKPRGFHPHRTPPDKEAAIERLLRQPDRPSEAEIAALTNTSPPVVRRLRQALGLPRIDPLRQSMVHDASPASQARLAAADENKRLRGELADALRRLSEIENLRRSILGLGEPTLARVQPLNPERATSARSAVLHISDVHYGELVDLDEMDGLNSYDLAVADARLARTFDIASRLLTEHWRGKPVERLHVCLGGDMVSGGIHEELANTDLLERLPSAKAVAMRLADGIRQVRRRVGCPVTVYTVAGNHGRLTRKPTTKAAAANSLDMLAAWFVEAALAADAGVGFEYAAGPDLMFSVYGRPFLLTHGDRMGSRGGYGFIGPVATITRGHFKLRADYATRGTTPHKILTSHFHTTCELPTGWGNGSLVGWSQLARDIRADKEPAQQNLLVVHSEVGVISYQNIRPGAPEEGAIYRRAKGA